MQSDFLLQPSAGLATLVRCAHVAALCVLAQDAGCGALQVPTSPQPTGIPCHTEIDLKTDNDTDTDTDTDRGIYEEKQAV